MEQDLVPYQAVGRLAAQRALVLAPHPDDETFGCGGAIAAHVAHRDAVRVVVLTDGAAQGEAAQRQQECRAACRALGAGEPQFWGLPDRGLLATPELVERVAQGIRDFEADLLYVPSPWEVHPDHRQAAQAATAAALATGVRVAFYEIGAPLRPNLLLDITPHLEAKRAAGQCFASQQAQQDYAGQLAALNRYRTYTLPREVQAAEAYLLLTPRQLEGELPVLLHSQPVAARTAEAAGPLPLVTVLVRSIDRPMLQQALDSIAAQTYPNIEVVVVAAQPGHRPLPARCGPHPLQLVATEAPLRRSQTANRALESGQGELMMFLDDDDWLLPSHVARLVDALQRMPQVLAAYTGVALVDDAGQPQGQAMDLPYDRVKQMAGNLTPIHSVLFRRELVRRGCRFDEALDRYEDWDFWLQAARHTTFAHVPGVSAAYRIHQSSGVHVDTGASGAASLAIYEKWRATWESGGIGALMHRAWTTEDLEQRCARLDAEVARRDAELAQQRETLHQQALTIEHQRHHSEHQQQVIAAREGEIRDLRASTSWRVTAPLRWVMARLRRPAP